MDEKETNENKDLNNAGKAPESDFVAFFWVGVAASAAGLILFILTLCLPSVLGTYGLIASILCALASLAFLNSQKKKNNFKAVLYVTIAAYILMAAFVAFFIGGIIYASMAEQTA